MENSVWSRFRPGRGQLLQAGEGCWFCAISKPRDIGAAQAGSSVHCSPMIVWFLQAGPESAHGRVQVNRPRSGDHLELGNAHHHAAQTNVNAYNAMLSEK